MKKMLVIAGIMGLGVVSLARRTKGRVQRSIISGETDADRRLYEVDAIGIGGYG